MASTTTGADRTALTPAFVYDQWRRTEQRRKNQRVGMRRAKYAYESRLWKMETSDQALQNATDEGPITAIGNQIVVEPSRMPGIIQTYTAFLFPRSPRAVVSPDVNGLGDPTKAQLAINRWFALRRIHQKFSRGINQSLLYRGSALKLGLDLTKRNPQDRVWAKIVPWWNLVFDWDVQDEDEARFVGHEYWEDRAVLERRLGRTLDDEEVTTEPRRNYFETMEGPDKSRISTGDGPADDRFVRVLEWYNLIDDYAVEGGQKLRGRLEIYLVGRLASDDRRPLLTKAMPYSYPDGEPCVPLFPLIFDCESEHPLRGIAFSDRIYSQCYELALLRTTMANGLRRDARIMLARKGGGLDETAMAQVVQGKDGTIVWIEVPPGESLQSLVHVVGFPAMNQDHQVYEAAIERDLNQGANVPKFTRGEAMGGRTTATEITQLNSYMENRMGELARAKDAWIAEVGRGFLRVLALAMKADALIDPSEGRSATPMVYVDGARKGGERITVTPEDLDAEFEINIADAASTPMTREIRRRDLRGLSADLMVLWKEAEGGNPMALTLLRGLVDLYDLPADFNPSTLAALKRQMEQEKAAETGVSPEKRELAKRVIARTLAQQGPGAHPPTPTPTAALPSPAPTPPPDPTVPPMPGFVPMPSPPPGAP